MLVISSPGVATVLALRTRSRRWVVTGLTAVALVATPLTVAAADPPKPHPSSSAKPGDDLVRKTVQLRAAQREARAQRRALGEAKQAVVSAQSELTARAAAARESIDRYAHAMARVKQVQARQDAAQEALAIASAETARQQSRVTE